MPEKGEEPHPAPFCNYTQLELFPSCLISLEQVFEAYYSCRKHKRKTREAMAFEVDLEENLIELWKELNDGTYMVGRSTVFIVQQPVVREIFAASFRDRIVHHLIINALNPVIEKRLVHDVYACLHVFAIATLDTPYRLATLYTGSDQTSSYKVCRS